MAEAIDCFLLVIAGKKRYDCLYKFRRGNGRNEKKSGYFSVYDYDLSLIHI